MSALRTALFCSTIATAATGQSKANQSNQRVHDQNTLPNKQVLYQQRLCFSTVPAAEQESSTVVWSSITFFDGTKSMKPL